jgi:purine-binding chemotaxis protein CheW
VGHPDGEILVFEVGGRRYGLPVSDVGELVRAVAIVPLPLTPAHLEGVVNLRGHVIPVHDLRARLGLPAKPVEPSDHLIITRSRGSPVALRIDRAVELVRLDVADVESAEGNASIAEGIVGVAKLSGGLAPILNLDDLIARTESHVSERGSHAEPEVRR